MPGLLIMNQNGADGAAGVKDTQGRNGDSMGVMSDSDHLQKASADPSQFFISSMIAIDRKTGESRRTGASPDPS
jgi:hypothetical protein